MNVYKITFTILLIFTLGFGVNSCSSSSTPDEEQVQPSKGEGEEPEEENDPLVYVGEETSDRLSANENRFYGYTIPNNEVIVNLSGAHSSADSELLNQEILNLSNVGGGIIRITQGTYYLRDVRLRSNIHLKFDANVIIKADLSNSNPNKNILIFHIGNQFFVENVAITSVGGDNEDASAWFTVDIPEGNYRGVRFLDISNTRNFKVSGIKINDSYSVFSAITLSLPDNESRDEIPMNGLIKNIKQSNSHVGYGVVQMQAGKTVLYKNLQGQGGVTLRVETGNKVTNTVNVLTVDDVVGRNISIIDGDAAVNFSPHRVDQGRVDVEHITAINSGYAIQLAAGFLDKTGTVDNIGTFSNKSYVGDITITGGDSAQIKSKDFKYFNCDSRRDLILNCKNPDGVSASGKSVGAIRDNSSFDSGCTEGSDGGCYEVVVGRIVKTNENFETDAFFVYPSMSISGCPNVETPAEGECL